MRGIWRVLAVCTLSVVTAATALAQQTSGNVNGRVLDQSQAAMPGVTITATNKATGFNRTVTTDPEGSYRLTSLPVGTYDLKVELSGFATQTRQIEVAVGGNIDVNFDLTVQGVTETTQVTAESPLIETSTSAVGGVVDTRRIESMPLNGRQFANLAATIPGVGLGMHSDPTKSTQFAPQIGGGNGRNLNYQIDGGDNNDDTVGGLLQLFPLEAIDQFQVVTSRYKAEYGRSNGGVLNIVTKSGTNQLAGSWFTLFRDKSLNAETETQRLNKTGKSDYRRYQYGGSLGGPIIQSKLQYFGAFERTQQDTSQSVSTQGLFPNFDGVFSIPYRETLLTGKVTATINPNNYLNVRYGRNKNSQPYDASAVNAQNAWGDSVNTFNSVNFNHNLVLGATTLNEFIFQYADFRNHIAPTSHDTRQTFQNGVAVGQSPNTPQTTEQGKYQFRDDFSWYLPGKGGIGHAMKAGVNWIHEPHLFITFNTGKDVVQYAHLDNTLTGPISTITLNGGDASANIPLNQYAFFVQDDFRVNSKLTLNLGLRYDVIKGYQIDQSNNPNFVKVQNAGAAGLLAGIKGLENFGKTPQDDTNNWQPRVGFAYDVRGDGKDVVRGGWGIYQDVGYTNSNLLFAAADASGRFGAVFSVDNQQGIRNPDGSLFQIGQPLTNLNAQNQSDPNSLPLFGQFLDPRLQMPYTRQTAFGWSHELMSSTVITVDFVNNQGRDLNTRPRLSTFITPGGPTRRLAFLNLQPAGLGTRAASSFAKSDYKGLIIGVKRRLTKGVDFTVNYTLQKALSTVGTAVDELNANNLQDATLLYDDPKVYGPATRIARHLLTVSAVLQLKGGIQLSPLLIFRTKLRAGKRFNIHGSMAIEAFAEVFNMFNAKNPSAFILTRTVSAGAALNPSFLKPTSYSGDFQQPDQRVGQIGARFTF
jgi:hypothetical protein